MAVGGGRWECECGDDKDPRVVAGESRHEEVVKNRMRGVSLYSVMRRSVARSGGEREERVMLLRPAKPLCSG
jgi:hypothetical protein